MNRCRPESTFRDSFDQWIAWSLRSAFTHAEPSPEVWDKLQQRVQTLERTACERRSKRTKPLLSRAPSIGHWLKFVWQMVDEHTVSSEAIWSPISPNARLAHALCYRNASLWLASWPVLNKWMPIY